MVGAGREAKRRRKTLGWYRTLLMYLEIRSRFIVLFYS